MYKVAAARTAHTEHGQQYITARLLCCSMQARKLAAYLKGSSANRNRLELEVAKVTLVQKVGMGDRCSLHTHMPSSGSLACTASGPADVPSRSSSDHRCQQRT